MKVKTRREFMNLVSFCMIMESEQGIMDKDPSYVLEKFHIKCPGATALVQLDHWNKKKYEKYVERWGDYIDSLFGDKDE